MVLTKLGLLSFTYTVYVVMWILCSYRKPGYQI